jgi:hypothetical protein
MSSPPRARQGLQHFNPEEDSLVDELADDDDIILRQSQLSGGRRLATPPPPLTQTRLRTRMSPTKLDNGIIKEAAHRRARLLVKAPIPLWYTSLMKSPDGKCGGVVRAEHFQQRGPGRAAVKRANGVIPRRRAIKYSIDEYHPTHPTAHQIIPRGATLPLTLPAPPSGHCAYVDPVPLFSLARPQSSMRCLTADEPRNLLRASNDGYANLGGPGRQ